jgi:hypothetical protein
MRSLRTYAAALLALLCLAAQARAEKPAPSLPPPDDGDRLVEAHHRQWVSGDLAGARRLLHQIIDREEARRSLRALAALRLAAIDEVTGDRRAALAHLEAVKVLAGSGHPLALEAEDRRARILTATPLADVRGPVPGTVTLRGEAPQVVAQFRQAEKLLVSYHRVVVAPSLENINEVLRTKRHALAAAVTIYQKVAEHGGATAKAASSFRIGAMYHHLAEALAFSTPEELLPTLARRLTRQLRAESATHLRRALTSYRAALRVPAGAGTAAWQEPARREAATLEVVLRGAPRRGGRAP